MRSRAPYISKGFSAGSITGASVGSTDSNAYVSSFDARTNGFRSRSAGGFMVMDLKLDMELSLLLMVR